MRHRNEYPVEGQLPAFEGATAWVNSAPLSPDALSQRVVLVSFGTYTCINWIRSLPYVRAWADNYADRGLAVIGVQTPEFDFEKELDGIRVALKAMDTSATPSPSTTTTPCGRHSTTTTGPPCTSSTSTAGSGTTASVKATTRSPSGSCRCCSPRPASTSTAR
jgi:hypothetical protein